MIPLPTGAERLTRRMARGIEFLGSAVAIACGAMTPELLDTEIAA